jgi:hypothetical protein
MSARRTAAPQADRSRPSHPSGPVRTHPPGRTAAVGLDPRRLDVVTVARLQATAGNAAVSALMAAKLKSPGEQAVTEIDAALKEIRRDEPAIDTVEKGLKGAKAAGVPVDLEGPKPPASALAVTTTGFGPGSVAAKKPPPPTKPVPARSPLGRAGAVAVKPGGGGGGAAGGKAPAAASVAGGAAAPTMGPAPMSADQLLQPPVAPTAVRPQDDPAFTQVTGNVKGFAKARKAHPPAASKAKEAQDAALAPTDDLAGQAKAAKADTMDAQQAGSFDKKAFIAAVKTAIEAKSPKTLKEADDYKSSGKAGEVKGEVKGLVTQGKEGQAKDIEAATEAPPDQSKAVPKPVTPMAEEQPGQAVPIPAAGAVPKPAPAEQVNLEAGKHQANQEMADAEVTEPQLAQSNEPEFQQALADKQAAAAHADTAPAEFRQHEQQVIQQGRTEAATETTAAVAGMQSAKGAALAKLVADKGKTKTKDEAKRAEVTAKIQGIFAATEADVKKLLDGLDPKVEAAFEQGEAAARSAFETYVAAKMSAYKEDRYSGWLGGLRWAKDKLLGMPSKVNEFYEAGRELYLKQMDGVISRVADIVGNDLAAAKTRIATGKAEIASYVKSLPADLKRVGSEASREIGEKFQQLESDVDAKQESVVDTLATKYVEARKGLDERIEALQAENKGLVDKAIGAIKAIINTIRELVAMLKNVLARVAGVVGEIIKNPVGFLGNLIAGVKGGILKFKDNILDHLRKGLMSWLFGALAEGGVELPDTFDVKGIIKLLASIFGLTWANIRNRIVKQIGAKAMAAAEKGVEIFQVIASQGVAGLWQMLVEKLGNIKEMILEQVKDFVITKIITAGITWLIGLLNPAAAFIKACKLIYDVVMFFVNNASRIMKFVNTVIDSVADIVRGNVSGVVNKINDVLGQMVPIIIGFLASVIGLGGIGQKIRQIIETLQKPVTKALDFVIKTGLKLAGPIIRGLKGISGKVKAKVAAGKAWVKGKAEKLKAVLRGLKKGFAMKGTGHTLTLRPGMPRVLEMASASAGVLSGKITRVLGDVEKRKAAVTASRLKVTEILAKGKKAGKRDQDLLEELNRYLRDSDELTGDVRQIDSLRAQVEALGPEAPESEVTRLVTRLTKRLEIFGMRYNLQDLGPLAPPVDKNLGDIGSYKEFSWGRKKDFGTLEAEHIMPGAILERLVGGWDPSTPIYTRTGSGSTYEQDTTLMVTKRIADIKTDIGSLRAPSDQAEIRGVKATLDRAAQIWQKVDSGQKLTKHERDTLAGLGELFNRVLARRIEVTIAARDQYIQELRRGQRGGMPDTKSLAAAIREIQTRCSDGKIHQAALEQVGRAWPLAQDSIVRVPEETA